MQEKLYSQCDVRIEKKSIWNSWKKKSNENMKIDIWYLVVMFSRQVDRPPQAIISLMFV